MNRNVQRKANLLTILILIHLLTPASCLPNFRKSCGIDLINRVARICEVRGGYNRMDYMRRKRNIIMECCKNACFDTQLYLYCSADTNTVSKEEDVKVDIVV